jgi:oxygen-dependent protoporphyrinogen oxidase
VRLAVVGGGITGLAAAWEGLERGAEVVVLEASDRLGGKIRTERVDGRVIEHGPDSFVAYRPAALALIRELRLGGDVISTRGTRKVYLRRDGRMHPLPDGMGMVLPTKLWPFVTTGTLSPWDKLRAAFDLVMPRLLGDDDVAIGAFLGRRLGRGIVTKFADPMVGGIYGTSVDELSLDAVLPSLRTNEREHRSLMLASLAQGRSRRMTPGAGSPFRTLRGGLGDMVDRLVAELSLRGADLRTGVAVSALEEHPDGTRVEFENGYVTADAVVLATGPAGAARLLAGPAPQAAEALEAIPLASTTVVTLAYPANAFAAPVTSHGWLEAGAAPVSGVTISSAKWERRAPDDEVLIRAFVPDRVGPLARAGDDEILSAVRTHVESALAATSGPAATWISRWRSVMPKYTVGHLGRVKTVEEALEGTPWRVAGSALHGVGIPDCIADGRVQAAAAIRLAQNRSISNLGSNHD